VQLTSSQCEEQELEALMREREKWHSSTVMDTAALLRTTETKLCSSNKGKCDIRD
jgi:hypothetical protein